MIMAESFLHNNVFNRNLRNSLIRFRFGVSDILCHRLKFSKINTNQLNCQLCFNGREDEFHVLCKCVRYEYLRATFLPQHFLLNRSHMKMYQLLADSKNHFAIALYLYNVFKYRANVLQKEWERGYMYKLMLCIDLHCTL